MMIAKKENDITFWQADNFLATGLVAHGFSTREGGVSPAPYDSLNLGLYNDDDLSNMQENRKRFAYAIGVHPEQAVCGHQVHQTKVQVVGKKDCGKGYLDPTTAFTDTDALITNKKGVALVTCFADCVPIMLLDPVQEAIGICHCGWRGTVERMAAKTVQAMGANFNSKAKDILVVIGPSISAAHYEVDKQVLQQFRKAFVFAEQCITQRDEEHGLLDLWQINKLQLEEIGVIAENIEISGLCTFQEQKQFFSHRASGGKTGRNAGILMLQE